MIGDLTDGLYRGGHLFELISPDLLKVMKVKILFKLLGAFKLTRLCHELSNPKKTGRNIINGVAGAVVWKPLKHSILCQHAVAVNTKRDT